MNGTEAIAAGRDAIDRRAWGEAFTLFVAADAVDALGVEDIERLAVASSLTGRDRECSDYLSRAHHAWIEHGNIARAAQCAFWLGWGLMFEGESARAGGWFARAQRLLDENRIDCAARGYLLVPAAHQGVDESPKKSYEAYSQVVDIGERFHDHDLIALGRLGQGESLIRVGQTESGVALLDEVMVAVTSGEISPIMVGMLYCAVIGACQEIYDLNRAQEWTTALTHWCESQPDLVQYRGQCLVHRAEIMQTLGAWTDALIEIQRARERLPDPPGHPTLGPANYQQAELQRLRGDFAQAEEGYRHANHWGHSPYPGLALLRMAQGQLEAAESGIRRALDEASNPHQRSRLLGACTEIMIAVGKIALAREAADDLTRIAGGFNAPLLFATSDQATGAVLLAEGDSRGALAILRGAWAAWQKLEIPYEGARTRTLIGLCYRAIGDEDAAQMEFDAARWVFRDLGATPDTRRVELLSVPGEVRAPGGLTAREVEVIRLVATGKTNRAIADELFVSEKTVARHMSNMFVKLNISSRAAATAWAFEHSIL